MPAFSEPIVRDTSSAAGGYLLCRKHSEFGEFRPAAIGSATQRATQPRAARIVFSDSSTILRGKARIRCSVRGRGTRGKRDPGMYDGLPTAWTLSSYFPVQK